MKTIAIIGGGFSGTMAAVNLARFSEIPLRLILVNCRYPQGRGVAYSTQRSEHLLNVAARNMSALADHPNHFVEWLRTRSEYAEMPEPELRETFVPRKVYGDYLRCLWLSYARPIGNRSQVKLDTVDEEVVDLVAHEHGATLMLAGGDSLDADKVLLATGNQPPAQLPSPSEPFEHPAYCASPWQDWEKQLPECHETVVLLGTGLTMVDALLTLLAHDWQGKIIAISRHGLLPLSHFKGIDYPQFPPDDAASLGLAALVKLVERHCRELRTRGENPAIVVDRLRPHTQRIWQNFSLAEKRAFCRDHSARWNVSRHRIAQSIHERMTDALSNNRLRVIAGSIRNLADAAGRIAVTVDTSEPSTQTIEAGLVVNCTGPQVSFTATSMPLFQNLLARGFVQADEMDMGIKADADFAVFDGEGNRSEFLFAVGPLLRGTLWETTAVPELRGQTFRVAQTLLDQCTSEERREAWPAPAEMDVLEYCI